MIKAAPERCTYTVNNEWQKTMCSDNATNHRLEHMHMTHCDAGTMKQRNEMHLMSDVYDNFEHCNLMVKTFFFSVIKTYGMMW